MSRLRFTTAALLLTLATSLTPAAPATTHFTGQTPCRDVALTFDAEFSPTTSVLVQKLEELQVRATFFLLGQSIGTRYADLVKRIASRHQIGNHSYNHPRFTHLSPAQVQVELAKTEELILELTGQSTKPFFRLPYGEGVRNQTVLQAVSEAGYSQIVHWSVDTVDWRSDQTAEGVAVAILSGVDAVTNGRGLDPIVLMHGHPAKTAEGVAAALPVLRERGYQFVTIAELFDPAVRAQREFGGDRYRVQAGDSLEAIAACHNLGAARLLAYNELGELPAGVEVAIPYRDEVILRLDGERLFFPVRTRMVGGHTMVHVRLLERLGAQFSMDEQGYVTVTQTETGTQIRFQPGSDQALVNGDVRQLVQPTLLEENRLLVPLSFLITQFDLKLDWNAELLQASLTK